MSSTANKNFWEGMAADFTLGFDGYTLGASKTPETDDDDKPAEKPAPSVPAKTDTAPASSTVGAWVTAHPWETGIGVVAVIAAAALLMDGRK